MCMRAILHSLAPWILSWPEWVCARKIIVKLHVVTLDSGLNPVESMPVAISERSVLF